MVFSVGVLQSRHLYGKESYYCACVCACVCACMCVGGLFNLYFSSVVAYWCPNSSLPGVRFRFRIGRQLVGDRTTKSRLRMASVTESQFADNAALYTICLLIVQLSIQYPITSHHIVGGVCHQCFSVGSYCKHLKDESHDCQLSWWSTHWFSTWRMWKYWLRSSLHILGWCARWWWFVEYWAYLLSCKSF